MAKKKITMTPKRKAAPSKTQLQWEQSDHLSGDLNTQKSEDSDIQKSEKRGRGRPPKKEALRHTAKQCTFYLPHELVKKLKLKAVADEVDQSELVRAALNAFLDF